MTMKANELRIGNIVYIDESTIVEIESISEIGANSRHGSETIYFDNIAYFGEKSKDVIKPIPLTEEWLLKFGFACIFTHDDHHYYLESLDLGLDRSYQPFGIGQYKLKFEYVHQLQNLYFALTGEELTVKNNLK